jgi:UDP-N-acetylmuramate dehydrogenase
LNIKPEINIPLAAKTTLKIGGCAAFYLQPQTLDDIAESIAWGKKHHAPVFALGNGSNVLISDKGWPGIVIDVGARFDRITWDGDSAVCLGGAPLSRLIREMIDKKLMGLETLGGIPGAVGGALVMNAGAYGHSVSECVVEVDYYDRLSKSLKTIGKEELRAGYRHTVFSTMEAIIVSVRFRFLPDASGKAREIYNDCLSKRKLNHPLDLPNCGSVFKNPKPLSAGALIESSGLKGYRIGGAEVSTKHANFIVNREGATAADVRRLIVHMQKTVYEKQNILLEPEVVFVGDFEEPMFSPHKG